MSTFGTVSALWLTPTPLSIQALTIDEHDAAPRLGGGLPISEDDNERLANVDRTLRLKPKEDAHSDTSPAVELASPPPDRSSPGERIEAALAEVRDSVARDLLENIGRSPPEFFEKLVLELLLPMGYGTSRSDLQRVGGSGDGGIDGIISLDRLGLEKVYIQAKRWKNAVGSPEIQGFMGGLQLQGAAKGVFVTTSSFTKDAKVSATRACRETRPLQSVVRPADAVLENSPGAAR